MKIKIKDARKNLQPNHIGIVKDFIEFLQSNGPIKNSLTISFTDKRNEEITTGKHTDDTITIFVKGRVLIDILRTLAHELVHAKQNEMGILQPDSGETGSEHENDANAIASLNDFPSKLTNVLSEGESINKYIDKVSKMTNVPANLIKLFMFLSSKGDRFYESKDAFLTERRKPRGFGSLRNR